MKSILLANVPHYHYLARALSQAGYLQRYITSISLAEEGKAPIIFPIYWKQKMEGRRLRGIPFSIVKQLWLPEILQRGLPMLGAISSERGNWINNHLFDKMALRWIAPCDIFHFSSSVGLYCARRAKSRGAIVLCSVREAHPVFQKKLWREEQEHLGISGEQPRELYENKVLEEYALADYLFVPSTYVKETFVAQGYPANRVFVHSYGADLRCFCRSNTAVSGGFRILYVGRVTAEKGVHYLLQAFDQLKLTKAELLLIGQIDPHFKPILKRYKGKFTHIPGLPKSKLASYYSSSSVLVLPTLSDSFGLVVLEAMACGLPVIVTENCGSKEVLIPGQEGFIVPIRDVEALKEKILFLYENPATREQMGNAAFERAQKVTWEAYGKRAQAFYRQLAKRNHLPVEMLQDLPVG